MKMKRNIALAAFGVTLGAVLILTQAGWSDVGSSKLEGVWVQLNSETKSLEKWLTHLVFGFGERRSDPGSGARLPR